MPAAAATTKSRRSAPVTQEREVDTTQLLAALRAFRRGDFSVRRPRATGSAGEIADAFNDVVEQNDRMTREFERLGDTVG